MINQRLPYYFKRLPFMIVIGFMFLNFFEIYGSFLINIPTLILTHVKLNQPNSFSEYPDLELLWGTTISSAYNKYRFIGETVPFLGLSYLITNNPRHSNASIAITEQLLSVKNYWDLKFPNVNKEFTINYIN